MDLENEYYDVVVSFSAIDRIPGKGQVKFSPNDILRNTIWLFSSKIGKAPNYKVKGREG